MKRTLILHIGAHKTGTTAIQSFLVRSRDTLAQAGWDLVDVNGVVNLGNTIAFRHLLDGRVQFYFRPDMLELLERALAENGRNKIISAEDLFFLNKKADLNTLRGILKNQGFEVKIVIYLRNQVDMGISNKAQGAKTTQSALVFGNDKRKVLPDLTPDTLEYLNYHQKISLWKEHFPEAEFVVRKYDRAQLADGDSVTDFVQTCNLPIPPTQHLAQNTSIGSKLTNLLHDLRAHGITPGVAWELFARGFFSDEGGIKQKPSAAQAAAFMATFEEDNKKIAQDYGIDLGIDCSTFPEEEILQPDDSDFIYRNIASVLDKLYRPHSPHSVTVLRDSAIKMEKIDLKLAYELMQMAHSMRPQGPAINKKLAEYREQLGLPQE